jgi:hypothetical protein
MKKRQLNDIHNEFTEVNEPSPVPLELFNDALRRRFGTSSSGLPFYRLVWGMEEKAWACGGVRIKYPLAVIPEERTLGWDILNAHTQRSTFIPGDTCPTKLSPGDIVTPRLDKSLKVIGVPRFILERWLPPDTRETWEHNRWDGLVDVLGPYPSQGQYFEIMTLETPRGEYLPVTWDTLDNLVMARIERAHEADKMSRVEWREQNSQGKARLRSHVAKAMEPMQDQLMHRARRFTEGGRDLPVQFESGQEYR